MIEKNLPQFLAAAREYLFLGTADSLRQVARIAG